MKKKIEKLDFYKKHISLDDDKISLLVGALTDITKTVNELIEAVNVLNSSKEGRND
ncbi:MAG: hypothetical protein AABY22_33005 [Nanoarchaeota archaeon]